MSGDKKDFMSLFDSIDKVNFDQDTEGFSVENIQDEKTVLEFLDSISRQKPVYKYEENKVEEEAAEKEAEKTVLIKENYVENGPIDDTEKTPRNSKETWFNGLLNNASFFVKQAEEKVKQFQQSEGKKIQKRVTQFIDIDTLGKLGIEMDYVKKNSYMDLGEHIKSYSISSLSSTFNSVLNVVAPPISLHEILEIEIYHDLTFFKKIEDVVYSVFDEVMSQIENEDVIVQKGKKDSMLVEASGEFCISEGIEEAIKLAKNRIEPFLGSKKRKIGFSESLTVYMSCIYLSIQAYSFDLQDTILNEAKDINKNERMLCFVVHLNDPQRKIEFSVHSQALPVEWINKINSKDSELLDDYLDQINEWVEKTLRLCIGIVAQSYIEKRNSKNEVLEDKCLPANVS
ncbi:hypothetical protein T552_03010 [Pneumocystis carinii B80]|uniref:Maintenance of telomere capping protein 1 n=1 Tax=Pneumocystis carinii (strain B80) TaxID=1408658 RepID=A0A0W4ZCH1_PNEC8|nr:hypothetical protein T552_03010 [Pneumocystis carinii B80]KTW26116.1 hypothetical protein T552_03010 [Pneumocystis carinii B80]